MSKERIKGKGALLVALCITLIIFSACLDQSESTPAQFKIVDLRVIPENPKVGDTLTILVDVQNKGDSSGSYTILVTIGSKSKTQNMELGGKSSKTVEFQDTADIEGDIEIKAGNLTKTISVAPLETLAPTTTPPPTTPPWQKEGNYIKDFEWEYEESRWTWTDIIISKSTYNYHHQMERFPYYEVTKYITEDKSGVVEGIAEELKRAADEKYYSEWERINFVIAFVQSLPYHLDDVSTGYDDWPKFPVETIVDGGGDCEDTSILVAALLNEWDYGVVLLLLPDCKHMAVGVWCTNCSGTYYEYKGRKYYYLETTGEGWEIGVVPSMCKDVSAKIYDIGFFPPEGSEEEVEEQTGDTGGNLIVMDIMNTDTIFYIWIKNATGYDLGSGDVSITIKNSSGDIVIKDSAVGDSSAGEKGIGSFLGAGISNGKEGQITATNSSYIIVPGETYTIIIRAVGITITQKYTAI